MNSDRRQREIERDERWLRGLATPGPSAEALDRVKLAVRQAWAGDDGEPIPEIDRAVAAAKAAVRKELRETGSQAIGTPRHRRWIRATAMAAVLGFMLMGVRREFIAGVEEDLELQRLVDVMDRDVSDTEAALIELARDIADLQEDTYGTAGASWSDSFLDGLGDSLDDLWSEAATLPETS